MKAMLPGTVGRIKLEVIKEVDSYFERKCLDMDTVVLWILHSRFGFGPVRLRRFFDGYLKEVRELQDQYGDYAADRMREGLKRIGVDVGAWEKEV